MYYSYCICLKNLKKYKYRKYSFAGDVRYIIPGQRFIVFNEELSPFNGYPFNSNIGYNEFMEHFVDISEYREIKINTILDLIIK